MKLYSNKRNIQHRLGTSIVLSEVVKENNKTILVKLADGNVIKRHKIKHCTILVEA